MNGVHDLGGNHGFGPVEREEDEPVFHSEWEARVFALSQFSVASGIRKCLDEVRYDVENLSPEVYLRSSYYERWLLGVERGLNRRGVITTEELAERRAALRENPDMPMPSNTDDEQVARVGERVRYGIVTSRDPGRPPKFAVGDEIVTKNKHTTEHTRLARYARGKRGTVERVFDAFPRPEAAAVSVFEHEHVYAVRFEATELWGESAEPNASVVIDLFESYLVPA